ncbi:MAG: TRAP transporter small permease subunit [Methylocystaceae bacterium]|nr:TRAP transporter small permease subunit [Methylocystaceae bacterium]
MLKYLNYLEKTVRKFGLFGSFLLPVLVCIIVVNVIARYGFDIGLIELEELQWHLNATAVLLCLGLAYQDDSHVRVDIFHIKFSKRKKALFEFLGCVFLLIPFVISIIWYAWDLFAYSFSILEGSPMPSGLPARYVIKFIFFFGFLLLFLQACLTAIKSFLTYKTGR